MRKTRIFTPGPTPLIPEAQLAMSRPIVHHRTAPFKELLLETRRNLQRILNTRSDVVVLASSGTGAMEAAVCGLLAPGGKALAVVAGKFGERWVEICQAHDISCTALCKRNGEAATAEEICEVLQKTPDIGALFIQGCETSTATSHDLKRIAAAVGETSPHVYIVVDAITALLTQTIETDAWNLDVVVGGSQKAFGLPPGLAFLSVSPRAAERIESNPAATYYLNLSQELKKQRTGQTAFTPAISLIVGLHDVTDRIVAEGPAEIIAESDLMARCTRKGLTELGFRLLSTSPAAAATAAFPPPGVEAAELIETLEKQYGIKMAGGQGELKGKIVRIAHLGYFDLVDVFSILSAIELCLSTMGVPVDFGASLGAALREAASHQKDPSGTQTGGQQSLKAEAT